MLMCDKNGKIYESEDIPRFTSISVMILALIAIFAAIYF